MANSGGNFSLTWTAPAPADQVDSVKVFEHVGTNYNLIATVAQPTNAAALTGVAAGVHNYAVKAHNAAGDSASYSNEVSVTVLALPAAIQNLAFSIG